MASVQNIGLSNEEKKGENERNQAVMPIESSNTQNKNPLRDTYWFAHGGVENIPPKNTAKSPNVSDLKDAQLQKDKEERIRIFREQQEEERLKKLKDLEQQFLQAKKLREQQEEERKRRIEEARIKETERRQQVEERKRQIWEAEQERKEAILRRNMEREARIEARRNAQRMAQSFAFGSSTPRTFDLDLAAIGRNTSPGLVLMSSVSRRSEERELGPPRSTSACSLDRKFGEDCMSRSMVSLSSSSAFRGRKRTDIMPTLTRERSITPHVTPRGNHCMRAVSMTRLDQLAQPRRPYRDSRNLYASPTTTNGGPRAISPSMTKSMCNLANTSSIMRKSHVSMSNNRRGNMSQSMMHLADTPQKDSAQMTPSPSVPKSGMRSAHSMMHLAAPPPPRLTRAARLRAQALASSRASSAWNLSKPDTMLSGQYLSPGKDISRSPSRPQSSMSGASEISATSSSISAVNMRTRSAPRRPRPFSIAGSIVDRASSTTAVKKEPESQRQPRLPEKSAQCSINKPARAKSVGREKTDDETPKPLSASKKPVPPPKSKEVLARAKSHPVPTKDNLRKNVRPNVTNTAKANIEKQHEDKGKLVSNEKVNNQNEVLKSSVETKSENAFEIVNSSPIISPVTDSEMCISSEDSRIVTESDINIHTQTFTESESKADQYVPINLSKETNIESQKDENSEINIPDKPEQKVINVNNNDKFAAQSQASETEQSPVILQKPRITSEEEARAALAEKRRLAREQAEREAELERQKQEELRRQEEEKQRIEEEKQREMEREAIRLAELHRQMEEEKLRKAIEEQKQREKEEQEKKQEEARLKAEKEEQERKAREEAEKQRLELEERLRKEEEERAERKRRVEQIMARTRGKSAQTPPATTPVDTTNKIVKTEDSNQSFSENVKTNAVSSAQESTKANCFINGSTTNKLENFHSASITNNYVSSADSYRFNDEKISSSAPLPDLLNTNNIANCSVNSNGHHVENDEQFSSNISVTNSFNLTSNRTLSAIEITSPTQTNGYSSHEDMSCTTSPEESTDTGLLVNIGSSQQSDTKTMIQPTDFTKLVDIESSSLNMSNENFLINVDSVNSNILSSEKSYTSFDESLQKKSDAAVTDLLL